MAKIVRNEAERDAADVQKVLGILLGVRVEWWEVSSPFPFDL